jgi:O-antigen/teichoic acid export membrane protein
MTAKRLQVPPAIAYIASIALDKGISIITIPLVAAYVTPAEYGRLDVAVSLIEFVGLLLTFGLADTLVRFAGAATDPAARRDCVAKLLGAGLLLAVIAAIIAQIMAPWLSSALGLQVGMSALRMGLAGAAIGALVEMPLLWLRLQQRSDLFLGFIAVRSTVQLVSTFVVLRLGWGADGILLANGIAVVGFALALAVWQIASTGVAFSTESFRQIGRYGLPLVGASLSMFALGSCSRWFMSGRVPDAEIACFSLAFKLALIVPLLLQPFALWWNPQRIAVLSEPDGLQRSAKAWGLGFAVLVTAALAVTLGGPVLIHLALPASYAGAAQYVPLVVLICFLNELNTLCNVGAYARSTGLAVLGVNASGALAALLGYIVLTPSFGVTGIIVAMILGHVVRLALFTSIGHKTVPIPYPLVPAGIVIGMSLLAVWLAPVSAHIFARITWSVVVALIVSSAFIGLGLIELPARLLSRLPKRVAHAG